MSELDLATRAGLGDFLLSHAYGLQAVQNGARAFAARHLSWGMTDYLALVQTDLEAMGLEAPNTSSADMPGDAAGAGACYVLLGSRLGMGVLRQRGYWRGGTFRHSAYMDDRSEGQVWAELLDWFGKNDQGAKELDGQDTMGDHVVIGATRAFHAFERGLAQVLAEKQHGAPVA